MLSLNKQISNNKLILYEKKLLIIQVWKRKMKNSIKTSLGMLKYQRTQEDMIRKSYLWNFHLVYCMMQYAQCGYQAVPSAHANFKFWVNGDIWWTKRMNRGREYWIMFSLSQLKKSITFMISLAVYTSSQWMLGTLVFPLPEGAFDWPLGQPTSPKPMHKLLVPNYKVIYYQL